jgi:phosphoglucosamine mutase
MQKFPQVMINVPLSKKVDISNNEAINKSVYAAEEALSGRGRVLLRPSGTEPIIRVMVEGDNQELVEQQVKIIAGVVEGQVG